MANIRFNIEKYRRNPDKALIFVIYDYAPRRRFKMSLKEKINPSNWDKSRHMVTPDEDNHIFINQIIANVKKIAERCRLEAKSRKVTLSHQELKDMVTQAVFPKETATIDVNDYSQSSYFKRFHEIIGNFVNFKDAYLTVEQEWNDKGVSMFPTYTAFRTGKTRYLSGQKKGFSKKAKALKE